MAEPHQTLFGPDGKPASMIFNSGIIRNPGKPSEEIIKNNFGGGGGGLSPTYGLNNVQNPFAFSGYPGNTALSSINTFGKNLRYYFASKFYQLISWGYVEYGLVRTIVDVPVEDGFRGGITFKTDQFDEKDLKKLLRVVKRRRDLSVAMRAIKWARLFGGGAVIAFVADQDPEEPLDLDTIGPNSKVEFRAVNMWELMSSSLAYGPGGPDGKLPEQDPQESEFDFYMYYGERIHKSRVHRVMGLDVPSILKWQLLGWGASILEPFIRPFNQYLKASDLTFEVLDEFKLDVFFIDGFKEAMASDEAMALMMQRVHYANGRKNFQNATVLSEKDKFEQRQLSFAGLAETSQMNLVQIAAVARMPLTKIFGISAAGFSTGQEDLENYNMLVESTVREPGEDVVAWMIDIRCHEMFGNHPDDSEIEFKTLRALGGVDEQTVKTGKATILDNARNRGDISAKEYREAANAGKLVDISLDTSEAIMAEIEDKQQATEFAQTGEEEIAGAKGAGKGNSKTAPKPKEEGKVQNSKGMAEIVTVGILLNDMILTGKRRDNGLWVSPGGHKDENETIEEAGIREVKEESGIELNPADLKWISSQKINSPRTGKDFILHCFIANVSSQNSTIEYDPDQEISEWRWVKIDMNAPELQPEARHAKDDEILEYVFKKKE